MGLLKLISTIVGDAIDPDFGRDKEGKKTFRGERIGSPDQNGVRRIYPNNDKGDE